MKRQLSDLWFASKYYTRERWLILSAFWARRSPSTRWLVYSIIPVFAFWIFIDLYNSLRTIKPEDWLLAGLWHLLAVTSIYVLARFDARGRYLDEKQKVEKAAERKRQSYLITYFGASQPDTDNLRNGDRWVILGTHHKPTLIWNDGSWIPSNQWLDMRKGQTANE